jgi:hypothetical protein
MAILENNQKAFSLNLSSKEITESAENVFAEVVSETLRRSRFLTQKARAEFWQDLKKFAEAQAAFERFHAPAPTPYFLHFSSGETVEVTPNRSLLTLNKGTLTVNEAISHLPLQMHDYSWVVGISMLQRPQDLVSNLDSLGELSRSYYSRLIQEEKECTRA